MDRLSDFNPESWQRELQASRARLADTRISISEEKKEWDAAGRIAITWAEQYLRMARILIIDRDMRTYSRARLHIVNEAIMRALDLAVAVGNLQGAFVYWKYPRESSKKH